MKNMKEYKNNTHKGIAENINNIIEVNNKYKKKGFNISLKGNSIEVIYNNSPYTIKVAKKEKKLYWHLEPYSNSYFETQIDNSINSIELLMVAIIDNEKIHIERNLK